MYCQLQNWERILQTSVMVVAGPDLLVLSPTACLASVLNARISAHPMCPKDIHTVCRAKKNTDMIYVNIDNFPREGYYVGKPYIYASYQPYCHKTAVDV